jgi:hypothetical protein
MTAAISFKKSLKDFPRLERLSPATGFMEFAGRAGARRQRDPKTTEPATTMNTFMKNAPRILKQNAPPLLKVSRRLLALTTSFLVGAWLGGTGLRAQAQPLTWLGGFEGINSGWTPADPIIAAGPGSLVTMVSGKIAIHNKQGAKLFEQNLGAGGFWWPVGGDQVAEPWVIYDPHTDRFMAVAAEKGNENGFIYLAVSKDSTPTGSADWHKYALQTPANGGVPSPDYPSTNPGYPKAAVDDKALYITTKYLLNTGFSHNRITAIDKLPLLAGNPVDVVFEHDFTTHFGALHPVMVYDPAAPMYFVTQDPNVETVSIYSLADVLTASPSLDVSTLVVDAYDQPPDVPQLGSTERLFNRGSRFMSGVVRNGSLWTAHAITDPAVDGESVVRWYQFDITGMPATDAILVQRGNVDPGPGIHTWVPHINVDADGNMGLGFSVGGASQYAAIGYTGRRVDDPAGYTLPVQIARAGAAPYTFGGWGEYSGLAIDPNGYTFWLFHEYPAKLKNARTLNWRTFVGAFEVIPPPPPADPLHCGDLDRSAANSGKNNWKATVVITMHDGNHAPAQGATVSIQWSGGASSSSSAVTDANGRCTFISGNISKQSPNATLTITSASHATLTYFVAANHDPDGDSTGTSITVNKP